MTITFRGRDALADFLRYLEREVRRGTVTRISLETLDGGSTRASIVLDGDASDALPVSLGDWDAAEPEPE